MSRHRPSVSLKAFLLGVTTLMAFLRNNGYVCAMSWLPVLFASTHFPGALEKARISCRLRAGWLEFARSDAEGRAVGEIFGEETFTRSGVRLRAIYTHSCRSIFSVFVLAVS